MQPVVGASFSDQLNNISTFTGIGGGGFTDKFGFTEPEVAAMLAYNGLNGGEMEDVRDWYDGYRYGCVPIYNPWSILQYAFAEQPRLE
jgi:hypothetical protein